MAPSTGMVAMQECLHRAQWHYQQLTPEGNRSVRELCVRALELDPNFAEAKASLANSFLIDIFNLWTEDAAATVRECLQNAEEAVALGQGNPTCHGALGWACLFGRQPERATLEFERAPALNPSYAHAYWGLGVVLYNSGRADEAVASIERAMRLSPHDALTNLMVHNVGMAHFVAGRYEQSADSARRSIALNPNLASPHRLLAACCGQLGLIEEAQRALSELHRIVPDFSVEAFREANQAVAEPMIEGWRKAGWVS